METRKSLELYHHTKLVLTEKMEWKSVGKRCLGVLSAATFLYFLMYFYGSGVSSYLTHVRLTLAPEKVDDNSTESTFREGGYLNSWIHHNCEDASTPLPDSEVERLLLDVFRTNVSTGLKEWTDKLNISDADIARIEDTISRIVASPKLNLRRYGLNKKHCSSLLYNNGTSFASTKPMLVKLYDGGFSMLHWIKPGGLECKNQGSHCLFYHEQKGLKIQDYDIVAAHLRGFRSVAGFLANYPANRSNSQPWIFFNTESQAYSFSNAKGLTTLSRYFNYTTSMGGKGDIVHAYGECRHITKVVKEWPNTPFSRAAMTEAMKFWVDFPNFAASKQKLILWVASNCHAKSNRNKYVAALSKHVQIDKLGSCWGSRPKCLTDKAFCPELYNKYKFYLAFENSLCQDYVTEKTFKVLVPGMYTVPIVMGLADYGEILPKNSYIDVRNFTSPEHLASYLQYLDKNDTAYNEYFDWRKEYICRNHLEVSACDFCAALHGLPIKSVHTQPDLAALHGSQNCVSSDAFFKKH